MCPIGDTIDIEYKSYPISMEIPKELSVHKSAVFVSYKKILTQALQN